MLLASKIVLAIILLGLLIIYIVCVCVSVTLGTLPKDPVDHIHLSLRAPLE